ncbi:MAG: GAF domain-containing sensor histidine kinase [Deltaproteobacteria bacterium]|nr:GAF domain-containing sensor histidine kinase [Deltaproteobacteria bacterium]
MTDDQEARLRRLEARVDRARRALAEAEATAERSVRSLYERERAVDLLQDITAAANSFETPSDAVRHTLERVCGHAGWPVGHAWELDPSGVARSLDLWSIDDHARRAPFVHATRGTTLGQGEGLVGSAALGGEALWVASLAAEPRFLRQRAAEAAGLRAGCWLPITSGPSVLGVMEFFTERQGAPPQELLELLQHAATQLGRSYERQRSSVVLSSALALAVEASKTKSSFLAMMSHEVRTPLNILVGAASVLADDIPDGDPRSDLSAAMEGASRRLLRTIHGILDLAQLSSGGFVRRQELVAVSTLVGDLVEEYRPRAASRGTTLTWSTEAPRSRLPFDEYCLRSAVRELLDNAVRFTQGGQIDVHLRRENAGLCLELRDTGRGMSPEFLPRAEEPFTQEDEGNTRSHEGVGIGLALARQFLQVNNATMTIESRKGRGTIVRITLGYVPGVQGAFDSRPPAPVFTFSVPPGNAPTRR